MPSSPDAAPAPRSDSETRILGGWLNEPLAGRWCMLGWGVATGLFVALATLTGGPGRIDAAESVYSTWAIAHGRLSCAFPSVTMPHEPLVAPVYPVVSGFVAALAGIGHTVPFPPQAAMGPHCETAVAAVHRWALEAGALEPTLWVAFTGWLVLAGGVVAWLRASGRGRCRWEPATVIVVACLPPVWICISFYFHPQDLFAMGFALAAMACARRGRWAGGGVLIALAILSQQFALLVAAPLLVLAPSGRRWRFVGSAAGAAALVVLPLVVASSGHALRAVTLGSGDNPSIGGTALWELSHRGPAVVVGSRVLPVVLALGLSWWVTRRVGPAALSAPAMVSLAAASLSLRLIFEQNLLPYYFMALVVALLLVDVAGDRVRGSLVAWLSAVLMVFCLDGYFLRVGSGIGIEKILPPLVLVVALSLFVHGLVSRRRWSTWNLILWSGVVVCAVLTWPERDNPFFVPVPIWLWQGVFALSGLLLALVPLLALPRRGPVFGRAPRRDVGQAPTVASSIGAPGGGG